MYGGKAGVLQGRRLHSQAGRGVLERVLSCLPKGPSDPDLLVAGGVTNMYAIAEKLTGAGLVVKP